ncbi:L-threonine kinase [compost metagenome]
MLDNSHDFLVTLPITRYSRAMFISDPHSCELTVYPSQKTKTKELALHLLRYYGFPETGRIEIDSDLPEGKGLASSSADLVATCRAIADYFQIVIPESVIGKMMALIEPTDGVMYSGAVSFFHRKVELHKFIGQLPSMTIISIDEGGALDTITYNQRPHKFSKSEKCEYTRLVQGLTAAIHLQDVRRIGEISTRSAEMNQIRNPKKMLNPMLAICKETEGLGLVTTHSGTCLGILLDNHHVQFKQQRDEIIMQLEGQGNTVQIYETWNDTKGWGNLC